MNFFLRVNIIKCQHKFIFINFIAGFKWNFSPYNSYKNGSITYISSTSGIDGNEGRGAYSDSKAAIISKSKVLSKELGIFNIRVNSIAPGLTNTSMMTENTSKEKIKSITENLSLKRFAEPNEIANTVLFLSSDLSSYITGQTIRVDGGM